VRIAQTHSTCLAALGFVRFDTQFGIAVVDLNHEHAVVRALLMFYTLQPIDMPLSADISHNHNICRTWASFQVMPGEPLQASW
jgi:hypothetical protein